MTSLDPDLSSTHAVDGTPSTPSAATPPPTATQPPEQEDNTLLGCLPPLGLLTLWGLCVVASPVLRGFLGPAAGLATAVTTTALWIRFGPRPMPGLLQGTMAMGLLSTNVLQAAYCIYLLF